MVDFFSDFYPTEKYTKFSMDSAFLARNVHVIDCYEFFLSIFFVTALVVIAELKHVINSQVACYSFVKSDSSRDFRNVSEDRTCD